jgi:purine-binding chemotaxis protein CheW
MKEQRSEIPTQIVTFTTGPYTFGINVLDVQEVLTQQQMTTVPLAPHEVKGLINLRGHIVTAIDMRERLGLPAEQAPQEPMNVVVQLKDGSASLLVDSVGDVIAVEEENYFPPPPALDEMIREIVMGVYRLQDRLLMHINPEAACSVAPSCSAE